MLIESSIQEKYIKTLNLGCFPRNVMEFQDSQEFFPQIVFIDYQLQLLIQNEFNGFELLPARAFEAEGNESPRQKLTDLISYANSINANYNEANKSFEEKFYYAVVLAQLFYLNSDLGEMHPLLTSIDPASSPSSDSSDLKDFLLYLKVRYNVLIGLTDVENSHKLWIEYLFHYPKHFNKSSVAANHWIDIIFSKVVLHLSDSGKSPLSFLDLKAQKYGENVSTIISLSGFLLRAENAKFILPTFRSDYSSFLVSEVESLINKKGEFPNASEKISSYNDIINTMYESLSPVPHYFQILPPTLSKKFMINMTSKTYQSQVVLSNYIKTLIELNEYDEALAAFKTYLSYVEKDQEQNDGQIDNILSIIDTLSTCILSFNPINSFIPRIKSPKRFKYTSEDAVMESLFKFTALLKKYLVELASLANLTYDDDLKDFSTNQLSFLYHKYNFNVLASDDSGFIQLVSKSWYSLGHFYYYLSTYDSSSLESLKNNTASVLKYYKNSLIVNSTGNSTYLFNYALALSYSGSLQPALKLCKFILKKYPEHFKTWNLLVLTLTSLETMNPDIRKSKSKLGPNSANGSTSALNGSQKPNGGVSTGNAVNSTNSNLKESEKFINNALNIAGIFTVKHRKNDIKLTVETKFEILQLKLTQFAVWEQLYGVQYILEFLPEVFILFHELFDEVIVEKDQSESEGGVSSNGDEPKGDNRWSHRPSFVEPSANSQRELQSGEVSKDRQLAKDKIKRMSKGPPTSPQSKTKPKPKESEIKDPLKLRLHILEKKILQELWLWTSRLYLKIGLFEETEQCLVEAENAYEPNVKTFTHLGYLTSKSRKFLSLQEFERSLEKLTSSDQRYNKRDYLLTLLGLCKLFIVDDNADNSLFISTKDFNAGIIRLKNLLEHFSQCWPHGYNSPELWYYLSIIYEKLDDKILLTKSLWRCVELEDNRPVRAFDICEEFQYY